ncbi:MAG: lysophospholipid acyltransferase family protein [Chloroflexota bacterium]
MPISQRIARGILNLLGWQIVGDFPDLPKYIIVGAPHTTNWDFPFTMLLMFGSGMRFNWIAKDSLFRGPVGGVMRRLGGIPVRREQKANFTGQIAELFERSQRMVIAISPEGTRSLVTRWKTGFYYMARSANVPIVMGFIDYARKQVGIGPIHYPGENIEETFAALRAFYTDKVGLHPHKQGRIEPI